MFRAIWCGIYYYTFDYKYQWRIIKKYIAICTVVISIFVISQHLVIISVGKWRVRMDELSKQHKYLINLITYNIVYLLTLSTWRSYFCISLIFIWRNRRVTDWWILYYAKIYCILLAKIYTLKINFKPVFFFIFNVKVPRYY